MGSPKGAAQCIIKVRQQTHRGGADVIRVALVLLLLVGLGYLVRRLLPRSSGEGARQHAEATSPKGRELEAREVTEEAETFLKQERARKEQRRDKNSG